MDFEIASKSTDRTPGVGTVWYAEVDEFAALQVPTGADQENKVLIAADHTFTNPTDGFRKMYTTAEKRQLEAVAFGEEDSGGVMVDVICFFPGSEAEFFAFLKDDPDLICIVNPFPCHLTENYQVGTACAPAKIVKDWAFRTGTIKEGVKGVEFKIRAYQESVLLYTGTITKPTP